MSGSWARVRGRTAALLVLLGGLFIPVVPIGWIVGVALVWTGHYPWRLRWLALLAPPGGLLGPALMLEVPSQGTGCGGTITSGVVRHQVCTTSGFAFPEWAGIALILALLGASIFTFIHLWRYAGTTAPTMPSGFM